MAAPSGTSGTPVAVLLIPWKTVGIAMILFMAGMQAVPEELYGAAKVDGAGRHPCNAHPLQ